jgi:hypothetical protein
MAKIYYKKYKAMIDSGEITLAKAIKLVKKEVPERWRDAVIEMLQAD